MLLFLLQVVQCDAQREMQGLWSSSRTEYLPAPANADAAFNLVYHYSDLYFEGDSVWKLQLPCKRLSTFQYSPGQFQFLNDSTFEYGGERYSRQHDYDSIAVIALKKHELNAACYSGNWFLVRTESGGDGTGVDFIFPYKIADLLVLKAGDLDAKTLSLKMDGEQRTFQVELYRDQLENQLILRPVESSKEKVMWERYWGLPKINKRELKALKRTEGIPLELRFRRI